MDWKRLKAPKKYERFYEAALAGTCSPRQAIKLHCIVCCGWNYQEARLCTAPGCPLYTVSRPLLGPNTSAEEPEGTEVPDESVEATFEAPGPSPKDLED